MRAGDLETLNRLAQGLMLGGFAMVWASQLRRLRRRTPLQPYCGTWSTTRTRGAIPWHGFKVGIGTLAVAALYECLLSLPLAELDVERCCALWPDQAAREKQIHELFEGTMPGTSPLVESRAKAVDRAGLRQQLEKLRTAWPQLSQRLREQLIPFDDLQGNAPGRRRARRTRRHRHLAPTPPPHLLAGPVLRRRFTVLDLAARTASLESALDKLFGPEGRWGKV